MKAHRIFAYAVSTLMLKGASFAANPPPAAPQATPAPAPHHVTAPARIPERSRHERYEHEWEYVRHHREIFWPVGIYYPSGGSDNGDSNYPTSNYSPGWSPSVDGAPAASGGGSNYSSGGAAYAGAAVYAPVPGSPADPELAAVAADYISAMERFKQALNDSPAYKAAVAEKASAEAAVTAMHGRDDASPDERLAAAKRKVDANKKLAEVEQDAAAKDDRLKAARTKLDAAVAARNIGFVAPK